MSNSFWSSHLNLKVPTHPDDRTSPSYNSLLYGKQFSGWMELSDWLVFGQDFTVRSITMETVRFRIFSLSREIQVNRNT